MVTQVIASELKIKIDTGRDIRDLLKTNEKINCIFSVLQNYKTNGNESVEYALYVAEDWWYSRLVDVLKNTNYNLTAIDNKVIKNLIDDYTKFAVVDLSLMYNHFNGRVAVKQTHLFFKTIRRLSNEFNYQYRKGLKVT